MSMTPQEQARAEGLAFYGVSQANGHHLLSPRAERSARQWLDVEEVLWLKSFNRTPIQIARDLGCTVSAVTKLLARHAA